MASMHGRSPQHSPLGHHLTFGQRKGDQIQHVLESWIRIAEWTPI